MPQSIASKRKRTHLQSDHAQTLFRSNSVPPLNHATIYISARVQRPEQLVHLFRPACFESDVDRCIAKVHTVVRTVVERIDDVGAMMSDQLCQLRKRTRLVQQMNPQADHA